MPYQQSEPYYVGIPPPNPPNVKAVTSLCPSIRQGLNRRKRGAQQMSAVRNGAEIWKGPSPVHALQEFLDRNHCISDALWTELSRLSIFYPAMALARNLASMVHDISMCKVPCDRYIPQRRGLLRLLRRLRLLGPFFEEIMDSNALLPPSSVLAFQELHSAMQRGQILLAGCRDASVTGSLLDSGRESAELERVNKCIASALEAVPLNLLEIPDEVKEQVLLVKLQASKRNMDSVDEGLRTELQVLLESFQCGSASVQLERLERLFTRLGLTSWESMRTEFDLLKKEIRDCLAGSDSGRTEELRNLAAFVRYSSRALYSSRQDDDNDVGSDIVLEEDDTAAEHIPDDFRCPISLEIMKDPVIIASGQTYDRESIQEWIWSGSSTCPKSGQKLIHLNLIPNHAVRNLIQHWCREHNVKLESLTNGSSWTSRGRSLSSKESMEVVRATAAFLVSKLVAAAGSTELQRQVAYELRLLAKNGTDNRILMAEAGAVPLLVGLLDSSDSHTQEQAVTALLNLSIYDMNKRLIVAEGAVEPIVRVLAASSSLEARQNAAATICSLSSLGEHRVLIGNNPLAMPSLVGLAEASSNFQAKKDAICALFSLMVFPGNRSKVVEAGGVQLLVKALAESQLVHDALPALALVAECGEGAEAIPVLFQLLASSNSIRVKENSLAVLLALCRNGGTSVKRRVGSSAETMAVLRELLQNGSPRAKRKAASLLGLLVAFPVVASDTLYSR